MALFRRRPPDDPPGTGPPDVAASRMPSLVRPQLWSLADAAALGDALLAREVADDLAAVLSLDLPTAVRTLSPDDADDIGLTEEQLWRLALAQLDDDEDIERSVLDEDETVVVLVSDSHFLASRLVALEALVGTVPPHGVLVAVPHRHMLVLHGIYDATVLDAVNLMAPFAVAQFEEGPGSLSPHLYWWHDGDLERLEVDDEEGSVNPTPGFSALLETLTA